MNKQEVIDSMIEMATEMNYPTLNTNNHDWEYYLLAQLYRALDQYAVENNLVVSDADRWF
jgi:hypothetical protein